MPRAVSSSVLAIATVIVFGFAVVDASGSGGAASPRTKLTIVAPAAPGGGWDSFAREAQQSMRENGIVNHVQVINIPGAGGTIGLSQVTRMEDRQDIMLVTGAVMVGAVELSNAEATLEDTTPIARLADDYNVVVVPQDSEYETLDDFIESWTASPGSHAIAGGSLGSIDHLLTGLLAEATGINPQDANYVAYPGGGEVVTSLLSNTAVVGISGYNDFRDQIEAGTLRALAISAEEPLDALDIPTFRDLGVDVAMSNWRGLVGPPNLSEEARDEMIAIVEEFRETPEWQDALGRNNWTDELMVGEEFAAFLSTESERITQIIEELGL